MFGNLNPLGKHVFREFPDLQVSDAPCGPAVELARGIDLLVPTPDSACLCRDRELVIESNQRQVKHVFQN